MHTLYETIKKTAGPDIIKAKHLVFAHPIVIFVLCEVFSCMLRHGYVPSGFCSGIVIALPKDKNGNLTDSSN